MTNPILSICLPTYNRSALLEQAITALLPGIFEHGAAVELVISDNASTDNTKLMLERLAQFSNVKVCFNKVNLGAAKNFDIVVQQAKGEFCWIVGDDDLVCPGGIATILKVLRTHPEIHFAFVNAYIHTTGGHTGDAEKQILDLATPELPVQCEDRTNRLLRSWNELIDPRISGVYLGSMMMCIFRRDAWLKGRIGVEFGEPFCSTLASVYPQAMIFGKEMEGRPAFYVGEPCIIARWGTQEWKDYLSIICAFWLHELLDFYQEHGVEVWRISKCRKTLLRVSGPAALKLLFNPNLPCRKLFSFRRYVVRFAKFYDFWLGLFVVPVYAWIQSCSKKARRLFLWSGFPRRS